MKILNIILSISTIVFCQNISISDEIPTEQANICYYDQDGRIVTVKKITIDDIVDLNEEINKKLYTLHDIIELIEYDNDGRLISTKSINVEDIVIENNNSSNITINHNILHDTIELFKYDEDGRLVNSKIVASYEVNTE